MVVGAQPFEFDPSMFLYYFNFLFFQQTASKTKEITEAIATTDPFFTLVYNLVSVVNERERVQKVKVRLETIITLL